MTEEFLAQYYAAAPSVPAADRRRRGAARPRRGARRGAVGAARRPRRGARRRARRQAAPARARRAQRRPRPRPGPAAPRAPPPAAGGRALRAAGRARAAAPAGADRGLRRLQPRRRAHRGLDGRLRGRRAEEVRLPPVPHPRRPHRAGPTTSPRSRRCSAAGWPAPGAGRPLAARPRARRELRRAPGPDRDRRRQGPAVGRACARSRRWSSGVRAGRGDRAGEADRGGVRPGPLRTRSRSPTTPRRCGCSSGCATRRTGSRSRTTAAAATRR